MNDKRVRCLTPGRVKQGPVLYWMSRDQRVGDNWALLYAQELALERKEPLAVAFCLVPQFLDATMRQYDFMLKGLEGVENSLHKNNISFFLLRGTPRDILPIFIESHGVGAVVTDFDPLKMKRRWKENVAESISVPFYEVDAHNVVPCWVTSFKQEFAARTIRPKIRSHIDEFLDEFPRLKKHPFVWTKRNERINWQEVAGSLSIERSVSPVDWIVPGEKEARKILRAFLKTKLTSYDKVRNDPTMNGQSNLSPYLHFGQISAQRVALEVRKTDVALLQKEAFLEELIVRRELSDNFCFYNEEYDTFKGFPAWAAKTLGEHEKDKREYLYSRDQFEHARTHDDLWNASQMEMAATGKMHGYMRMYWAKKILEWSHTSEEALNTAVYLNNRYELDGRDPSGYVGCAWSIGGVHDRAWFERPIFGKIRYMSYNGCKSKFNVDAYVDKSNKL